MKGKKPGKPQPKPAKAPASTGAGAAALFEQYRASPDDTDLLRVYADALERDGDPRGQFIQFCLADSAPLSVRQAITKTEGKRLLGPAGDYLREWQMDYTTGLVAAARVEADKLIAGIHEIERLNPELILTVTSVKTQAIAAQLGKLDLGRIWFVDFTSITGSHGGTQLSDKLLAAIAPAFANVRHLALSCRGDTAKCFSPAGLRAFGAHAKALEYLCVDYYSVNLAPPADYARAIAEAFPGVRKVGFFEAPAELLGGKKLAGDKLPTTAAELKAALA